MGFLDTILEFATSFFTKNPEVQVSIPFGASVPPESAEQKEQESTLGGHYILTRQKSTQDGIFGQLTKDGYRICSTLEHAYNAGNDQWVAKLSAGEYTCKRGLHKLEGMDRQFEAFQVMDVPDFRGLPVTGILFHIGNYNRDSAGCILVGQVGTNPLMICESKGTFDSFMYSLKDTDTFTLTVQ